MRNDPYQLMSRALGVLPIETDRELAAFKAAEEVICDAYRAASDQPSSRELRQAIRAAWIASREWCRLDTGSTQEAENTP